MHRHTRPSEDDVTNLMGVAQAIISIFADDGDRLRYVLSQIAVTEL